jgi:formylglycine-generating enzyme required for sulfatase activity
MLRWRREQINRARARIVLARKNLERQAEEAKASGKPDTADDGYAGTCPFDAFPPNGSGLCSMTGNTWE